MKVRSNVVLIRGTTSLNIGAGMVSKKTFEIKVLQMISKLQHWIGKHAAESTQRSFLMDLIEQEFRNVEKSLRINIHFSTNSTGTS